MTAYLPSQNRSQAYLPTFAEPEQSFNMEGFATIDPNTSSSEVLKVALYGGYTRFELELEVPLHFGILPK